MSPRRTGLLILLVYFLGFPPPKRPVCEAGLGLESYDIPDSSVTASSILWPPAQAANGRLHFFPKFGQNGGWVAHPSNTYGSWFQVDFGRWTKVTRISTQGRQDADEWVTKYGVSYSYEGIFFKGYQEHGGMPKVIVF